VFDAFLGPPDAGKTFFHGHTYTGNPLGCAVALASLDLLQGPEGLPRLPEKIDHLRRHLDRLRELPHVGEVRQRGLMAGVELVRNRQTRERFPSSERVGARVCRTLRDQGILLRPLGDIIVVMPPLAITPDLMDRLGQALYDAVFALEG
jgi:adenosylmethionine-8-amino-7-oxononanoate aminotransferase